MLGNKLIFKNSMFLFFRTIIITIAGFLTVRELLKVLGVEEYGLFNLVFGIATLFSFFNGAMISSSQRFLSYYIEKDSLKFKDVWRSSLILHFLIAVFVAILMYLSSGYIIEDLLNINKYLKEKSLIIYLYSIFYVFILIIQAPFSAIILAYERMKFFAMLALVDALLKLFIIYLLYCFDGNYLEIYTILLVASAFFVFIAHFFYCYSKFNIKFDFYKTDFEVLKKMISYCLWNIFGNFAFLSKVQGLNIILNIFFGLVVNSAYAITNTVVSVVNNLINSVVTAFNPQIYKTYASGDYVRNSFLINTSSKISFYLGYFLIVPIIFNLDFLLNLWLEVTPLYLLGFLKIALIVLLIDSLSGSIMTGIQATGKIKAYQIVVSLFVFLNLPISYIFLKSGFDADIIYVVAIFLSIISLFVRLFFLKNLVNHDIVFYFRQVILKGLLVVSISLIFIYFIDLLIIFKNPWIEFFVSSILFEFVILSSIIFLGLSVSEKKILFSKVFGHIK